MKLCQPLASINLTNAILYLSTNYTTSMVPTIELSSFYRCYLDLGDTIQLIVQPGFPNAERNKSLTLTERFFFFLFPMYAVPGCHRSDNFNELQ